MSETEKFGEWTLRQRWPGRWYLHLSGTETEIDVETSPDIDIDPDAMAVQVETPDGDACYAYPPIAAIERLLCLRRAALATEAQAPSGEPWRPAVGEMCFYYTVGEWRLCRRLEDDDSDIPQRFEKSDRRGSSICHCNATYDGIRPLGSLPVPPSCGGEPEPRGRAGPVAPVSPAAWGAAFEALGREPGRLSAADQAVAFLDCAHEIEREIAALGPPSIAEDLRAPEPGAFEGAVIVGVDLARGEDVSRVAAVVSREAVNEAVRGALAELRGMLEDSADENHALNPANAGLSEAVEAADRFAERFK